MSGSNTLGATIRLEGEKEYRESITKINSSLKVLASEMNKVTAEFSKNDKSTAALTAQSKILSSQIEAQKGKVATLRGALEESSQKYGENGSQCAAPVGEAGVLTSRKKHRELQAAAGKATMFLTGDEHLENIVEPG